MNRTLALCSLCALLLPRAARAAPAPAAPGVRFAVSFSATQSAAPLDGRLLVYLSTDGSREPREQVEDGDDTQQVFGVDVDGLAPGAEAIVDAGAFGYPLQSLAQVPPGDYFVQAFLHRYETFQRGAHLLKLPPDRGEGQSQNLAPGNLYGTPRKLHVDAAAGTLPLALDHELPPLSPVADTKYVRHVRFLNERLTRFWGRPVWLGAIVLLPEGFDSHPQAHYPLVINHGHFQRTAEGFREAPPDLALPPVDLEGLARDCPNGHEGEPCKKHGYERLQQELAHQLYLDWTGPAFPRVIEVWLQHANPYFDDSYAVNSDNLGPYGDAITYDLIPQLEARFRGLGPWARAVMGGSTGGWEALAAQVFYPDQYNGAVAACPDPLDFRALQSIDIYADENAYESRGPWRSTPRPEERDALGRVVATVGQTNQRELAMGTHSRSGLQWDAWEAVFSPVGPDGYPQRLWDKRTGAIDKRVAAYWREHFDLNHILQRDWATLQPKLRGKLELYVSHADSYYLNGAVYYVEEFLDKAVPPADAHIEYGARDGHCWSGDHSNINAVSRLTWETRFIPRLVQRWLKSAPAGADVTSWRY